MNRTIRGMAGLLVALGASACANDYSLDFGGPPTQVQASPETMFITSGAAPKELLLRLVNDRNQSVPAEWTVTNVPAGLTVVKDEDYRPDWINPDEELKPDPLQVQHRYFVSADVPTGGQFTFTVSSQGISRQITVRVLPTTLGAALSATAPAIGDEVTITAPANLSFTTASTVSIPGGGEAVIVSQDENAITFLPIPGSSGPATVSNVVLDYAPTLDPRSLSTSQTIDVPAVTSIPLNFSSTAPLTPVTVTATGFRFEAGFTLKIGDFDAYVESISGDGTTATVILPATATGTPIASGIHLSFLSSVSLSDIPGPTPLTIAAAAWNGSMPDGSAPVINAAAAGTEVVFYDTWVNDNPADAGFWGGPGKYIKLVIPSGGSRTFTATWSNDSDPDFVITPTTDIGDFTHVAATGNPVETMTFNLAAGTYWIGMGLFAGDPPGVIRISIE